MLTLPYLLALSHVTCPDILNAANSLSSFKTKAMTRQWKSGRARSGWFSSFLSFSFLLFESTCSLLGSCVCTGGLSFAQEPRCFTHKHHRGLCILPLLAARGLTTAASTLPRQVPLLGATHSEAKAVKVLLLMVSHHPPPPPLKEHPRHSPTAHRRSSRTTASLSSPCHLSLTHAHGRPLAQRKLDYEHYLCGIYLPKEARAPYAVLRYQHPLWSLWSLCPSWTRPRCRSPDCALSVLIRAFNIELATIKDVTKQVEQRAGQRAEQRAKQRAF